MGKNTIEENTFILYIKRGIQWQYAEENQIHIELDEIDSEDWENYGEYQDIAATLFNTRFPLWHTVKIWYDRNDTEHVIDYFDNTISDFDEYMIGIEPRTNQIRNEKNIGK